MSPLVSLQIGPGACFIPPTISRPIQRPFRALSISLTKNHIFNSHKRVLKLSAQRSGGSLGGSEDEADGLPDASFLPSEDFDLVDEDVLDEDEAEILGPILGGMASSYKDIKDEEEPDESFDEGPLPSRRGRGRGVEAFSDDDKDLGLLDELADVELYSRKQRGNGGGGSSSGSSGSEEEDVSPAAMMLREFPTPPERRRMLTELLSAAGMMMMEDNTKNSVQGDVSSIEISNIITCNSASAGEGPSLYVCVPCHQDPTDPELDGHAWADEAMELGAVAVIASQPLPNCLLPVVYVQDTVQALGAIAREFYDNPAQKMVTVGFVGSHGKTTSSWLTEGIIQQSFNGAKSVGMVGDCEYCIDSALMTEEGDLWEPSEPDSTADLERSAPFRITPRTGKYDTPITTPDVLNMQKVLAGMADRGAGAAMIEICPSLSADGRIHGLKPSVLVFTNIDLSVARADSRGEDVYVEGIFEMFANLDENQTAIVNIDDEYGKQIARMVEEDTSAQLLTYGVTNKDADVVAEKVKPSIWESEIIVRTPLGKLEIRLSLIGGFNVLNALAAVSVGLAFGIKLVSIVAGIETVQFVPGRTEVIDEGQPFPVIIDGAKSPEQIGRLIDEVKEAGARRTIVVVGCPGGTSKAHREAIGSITHFKADVVFYTNDSPGLEQPNSIIKEITDGLPEDILGLHQGSFYPWLQDVHRLPQWFEPWLLRYQSEIGRYVIEDRFTAIRVAIGLAKQRDVVLIVGRGKNDVMEYWNGIPPPRTDEERVAGQTAKAMAENEDSPEYQEELKWEAVDEYYEFCEREGIPVERNIIEGWFDDCHEARNAVLRLSENLNKLKDLDRSTLPWTRYPEEREAPGLSVTMRESEAASTGALDQYLSDLAENVRGDRYGLYDEDDDDDDEEEEEEEEEEEDALAF